MEGILREVKGHRYFLSKREVARMKAKKNARRRRLGRQKQIEQESAQLRRWLGLNCEQVLPDTRAESNQQKITEPNKKETNVKIYAGNLSYEVTEEQLQKEFAAFGEVISVNIVKDKYSGRSKGFGFVEMSSASEGQAAIDGLNGKALEDRTLVVNEARPRSDSRDSRSYGSRKGGGFGGRKGQRRY